MTLQERLRDPAHGFDRNESHSEDRYVCLCEHLANEAADALDAKDRALREIAEEWAGAECGEPVTAQEAYAIHLCKRMYGIAVAAIAAGEGK
jgi:hypothetical protein